MVPSLHEVLCRWGLTIWVLHCLDGFKQPWAYIKYTYPTGFPFTGARVGETPALLGEEEVVQSGVCVCVGDGTQASTDSEEGCLV